MQPVSEADFQRQVIQLAEILGFRCLHVRKSIGRRDGERAWQTTTSISGWCDLLLWRPGRIVAAELKSQRGRATPEQLDVLESLRLAGAEAYLWRPSDWPEVQLVLARRT